MRVLQLYHKMPFPVCDGGAFSLLSATKSLLSQHCRITVLAINPLKSPCDPSRFPAGFLEKTRFDCVDVDNRIRFFGMLSCLIGHRSYFASRFYAEEFENRLANILKRNAYDIIQLEHLYLTQYIGLIRSLSKAKIVLRAQNVEHRVWLNFLRGPVNPALRFYLMREVKKLKKFEEEAVAKTDGVIALSDRDSGYFRQAGKGRPAITVPIGFEQQPDPDMHFRNFPAIYHLGSMDWHPNIQGLKWFVKKILPRVVTMMPEIRIHISGRNMPAWFFRRSSPNLVVGGLVDDALTYSSDKTIMIVPLLAGGGIRVKILEAMSLGKTVISTSVGASGIDAVHGSHLFLADRPEEFASRICQCARSLSLCREMGNNARQFVEERYGIFSSGEKMVEFYHTLLSARRQ